MQLIARGAPPMALLRRFAIAASPARAAITLRVVGSAESKRLNWRFRRQRKPTNVLSFPYDLRHGDVVLCHPVIKNESKRQGKSLRAHYAHMVVHGVLHLRGYDHARARDASRMERAETRILRRLGFGDPYAVRSVSPR